MQQANEATKDRLFGRPLAPAWTGIGARARHEWVTKSQRNTQKRLFGRDLYGWKKRSFLEGSSSTVEAAGQMEGPITTRRPLLDPRPRLLGPSLHPRWGPGACFARHTKRYGKTPAEAKAAVERSFDLPRLEITTAVAVSEDVRDFFRDFARSHQVSAHIACAPMDDFGSVYTRGYAAGRLGITPKKARARLDECLAKGLIQQVGKWGRFNLYAFGHAVTVTEVDPEPEGADQEPQETEIERQVRQVKRLWPSAFDNTFDRDAIIRGLRDSSFWQLLERHSFRDTVSILRARSP